VSVDEQYAPAQSVGVFEATAAVVSIGEPTGVAAESIRALRTQLVSIQGRDQLSQIAICGPTAEVGTTFVAVNLAVALSQIGVKTLLVDADLRDPGVHRMIVPPEEIDGLRQCLEGEVQPEDAVQHEVMPNLSILYSGGAAPNPQELLSAPMFREMAALWSREYDMTIVDTPPANLSADSRYISGVMGAAVVVARKDYTAVSHFRTVVAELEQSEVNVVGTVLNQF